MTDAIEVALRSTHTIVNHLVQKSGASKAAKAPQDTDYKAVLDTFVADLLTVLYRPEWPAASLFLTILSKILVRRDTSWNLLTARWELSMTATRTRPRPTLHALSLSTTSVTLPPAFVLCT